MRIHPFTLLVLTLAFVAACAPGANSDAAPMPTIVNLPTAVPHNSDVADLLRHPPAPGASVEVDAYYSGATFVPIPDPRIPSICPSRWPAALTDRPLLAQLHVLYSISGNGPPDDAPWLIAAKMKGETPELGLADLPYHARLRGHLGDPAFAQCQYAERIFTVEAVVATYQQELPESKSPIKLPDDYATWHLHHDEALGYSLRYPPDWQIERLDDAALRLRAPPWRDDPITVSVRSGETHLDPYDFAAIPPFRQGAGGGPFQQDEIFQSKIGSQRLDGVEVMRQENPGEREVAVLFSGSGRTYELSVRYPMGFEAPQPLLTAYTIIVQSFRLDVLPGPSPTPPVKRTLGQGPFISKDEAVARARDHIQRDFTLLNARLVPEVDLRRPDRACAPEQGHFDGLWMLTVRYPREGTEFTAEWWLDAINGKWLCGEEIGSNARPFPLVIPPGAPTPAPTRTPFPTPTRVSQVEKSAAHGSRS